MTAARLCTYGTCEDETCPIHGGYLVNNRVDAPELSETEAAIVARFEAAPAAPESYRWVNQPGDDRQHRGEDCPCDPIDRGNGVVDHR